MRNKKAATLVLVIMVFASRSFAQEDSANMVKQMNEVVITGQYKAQSVKQSVYQVRVITQEQIQKQAAAKLQDVLGTQLNIRFSQDVATGGTDISMLGLSGQNVKILIDGAPMVGRSGTSNEIDINQVDINAIERIEIIEGPMSVIYGADALAGVINIITKRPKLAQLSVTARLLEETVGNEYGIDKGIHNQYINVAASYKKWYASGSIGRNLFNGWKDSAIGRELLWHKKDQIVGNALLGYKTDRLNVYYRLDGLDEIITNPANTQGTEPAIDQEYMTDRLMQQVQGTYTFSSKLSANALGTYTHFSRQLYSTLYYPNGDVRVATAPGLHSLNTFNGYTFRSSAVYTFSQVVSIQPGLDFNGEKGEGERIKSGGQQINDYALFITSEIKPSKKINIRPGLRFVKNSVYDAPPVIPSLNLKAELSPAIALRLAYATGFRAPSLRELYFDFFDASHQITGNPNLQAEHSNSFTGSLTYEKLFTNKMLSTFLLSGFYNNIDNMIGYAVDANNPAVTTYINISKYKTRGFSFNNTIAYKQLKGSLGFAYTARYNEYSEQEKSLPDFKWSPEVNAIVTYSFKKAGLDANLYYKYTGKLPYYQTATGNNNEVEYGLAETAGYNWADITLNKKAGKLFIINGGVRNLFNVTSINNTAAVGGVHTTSGARPIGYGRSYFLGLTFNWEKLF